jgi:homocysteine S-methyltransferase
MNLRTNVRKYLPQLAEKLFLTDAGLETFLIFERSFDLPHFAAFDLLTDTGGTAELQHYYASFAALARANGLGFVFETPTWRANRDWGVRLGYGPAALAEINKRAVDLLAAMRREYETPDSPMVISGNIGPRGDGYRPGHMMSVDEAEDYHMQQIETFCETEADLISAFTISYIEEAIGIARAADARGMPSAISFTLEVDGKLPAGQYLEEAIGQTDFATDAAPAYYMVNCAHPSHFQRAIVLGGPWLKRLRGLRANASDRSHAELDLAAELDAGDPMMLGRQYRSLRSRMPHLTILGGCCGTDLRHVEQICAACATTTVGMTRA